ncbi:hypothetical protein N7509_014281 [Penicillium cosmopolitanum]|uniref:EamA domain-containing protein n=1 Tax=Penicillium cosmopolitanum TaxID=1131564 RepID=A0A9W9V6N4_9EURO|nr:uncharacterized protein N7509_014281 [Penicillium cosmopolitanum]KAJ5369669.1 hypothetical protein N7509_014281 [Penicillium cosmopolitanum]
MPEQSPHQPAPSQQQAQTQTQEQAQAQARQDRDYQNHPDAPLPQSQSQPYRDDPDPDLESLAEYEPRPIDEDEENADADIDALAASTRPRTKYAAKARIFWLRNKGMILVLLAQMFGASMNVMTQVLEIHSSMHPFQILFARMSITALASYIYMFIAKTPHPLGTRPVLPLLLFRAVCGFTGVYALYYSVQYLPLSEATVITFLAPIMTCYACSVFIPGETFSRRQQVAAVVSLVGVVLIARPFRSNKAGSAGGENSTAGDGDESPDQADAYHHVLATIVASIGVLGAAGAYTSIRMIGRRAHPLVSVTYFSSVTTIISLVAMLVLPSVEFRVPTTIFAYGGVVLCAAAKRYGRRGAGAGAGKGKQGSKATSMVYTQMLFALFYDKVVWGTTLDGVAWVGSGLILACAVYVAVMQEGARVKGGDGGGGDDAKVQEGGGEDEGVREGREEESVQSSAQ